MLRATVLGGGRSRAAAAHVHDEYAGPRLVEVRYVSERSSSSSGFIWSRRLRWKERDDYAAFNHPHLKHFQEWIFAPVLPWYSDGTRRREHGSRSARAPEAPTPAAQSGSIIHGSTARIN